MRKKTLKPKKQLVFNVLPMPQRKKPKKPLFFIVLMVFDNLSFRSEHKKTKKQYVFNGFCVWAFKNNCFSLVFNGFWKPEHQKAWKTIVFLVFCVTALVKLKKPMVFLVLLVFSYFVRLALADILASWLAGWRNTFY